MIRPFVSPCFCFCSNIIYYHYNFAFAYILNSSSFLSLFFLLLLLLPLWRRKTWQPCSHQLQNNGLSRYTSTPVFSFHNSVIEVCVLTASNKKFCFDCFFTNSIQHLANAPSNQAPRKGTYTTCANWSISMFQSTLIVI